MDRSEFVSAQIQFLKVWNRGQTSKNLVWAHQNTSTAKIVRAQVQVYQLSEKAQVAWESAQVVGGHL